VTWTNRS